MKKKSTISVIALLAVLVIGGIWIFKYLPMKQEQSLPSSIATSSLTATSSPAILLEPTNVITPTSTPTHQIPFYPVVPSDYSYSAKEIIRLVNVARTAEGLPALTENIELDADARGHADYLYSTGILSHYVGNGTFRTFISLQTWLYGGENLGEDFPVANDLVSAWLTSPTHRANIMNPNYKQTGVALAGPFVVQLFTN